ncbi:MAG: DNA polymerase III subunit delta', partial [Microcystaceae cyanobacterium]
VELLQQALSHQRIAPAYLFAGPPGVGRGLAAKCFSEQLLCVNFPPEQHSVIQKRMLAGNHPDLLWVQPTYLHQGQFLTTTEAVAAGLKRKAPPQIRIEQVRDIIQFLSRLPLEASRSVVVVEDAQTMTEAAANALLKTLEEPGRATILLITPGTDALLPTLVSRCQCIPFYRLSEQAMEQILQKNGYGAILEHPELLAIAQGSPGEAIFSLTQLQSISETLLQELTQLPQNGLNALELAQEIDQQLDIQTQLWLLDYLQYSYWQNWQKPSFIEALEKARQFLLSYVQPRLVWECTLLELSNR